MLCEYPGLYRVVRKEERRMRKRHLKKLTLNRETVRHLAQEELLEAKAAAGKIAGWSDPPKCDPVCTSQTVSCTL
jgi:hypothetical protein